MTKRDSQAREYVYEQQKTKDHVDDLASVRDCMDQLEKLNAQIWKLGEHTTIKSNPFAERHLDNACRYLICCQNTLWNKYFNYGRIQREKEQAKVEPFTIWSFIREIF
jgi:hypothetical protein